MDYIYILGDYVYGSPRYHLYNNTTSLYKPEDFALYDRTNGTYDKLFPLFALTETEKPTLELIASDGTPSEIQGSFAPFILRQNFDQRVIGAKFPEDYLANTNLDQKTSQLVELSSIKLNTGLTSIQIEGRPLYLKRMLPTPAVIKEFLAHKLTTERGEVSDEPFPKGYICYREDNERTLWMCLVPTTEFPPFSSRDESENWVNISEPFSNVFKGDVFMIGGNGIEYLIDVADTRRRWNPLIDIQTDPDSLVAWNMDYYHQL